MSFETIHILKMKCELELVDQSPAVSAGEGQSWQDTHGDRAPPALNEVKYCLKIFRESQGTACGVSSQMLVPSIAIHLLDVWKEFM